MPRSLKNPGDWTLKKLIQSTHLFAPSRFDNMERDVLKRITVERVTVYDQKKPGEARTTYRIRSYSYPQYGMYLHKTKTGHKQRRYLHDYAVILQLDHLSINVPFRLRTGSEKKYLPGQRGKIIDGKLIESQNYLNGKNMDFFMRLEWLYKDAGILYGRCTANGPPLKANPQMNLFLDKHALSVIRRLMSMGVLKN